MSPRKHFCSLQMMQLMCVESCFNYLPFILVYYNIHVWNANGREYSSEGHCRVNTRLTINHVENVEPFVYAQFRLSATLIDDISAVLVVDKW